MQSKLANLKLAIKQVANEACILRQQERKVYSQLELLRIRDRLSSGRISKKSIERILRRLPAQSSLCEAVLNNAINGNLLAPAPDPAWIKEAIIDAGQLRAARKMDVLGHKAKKPKPGEFFDERDEAYKDTRQRADRRYHMRVLLLVYGFLRGTDYKEIERSVYDDNLPPWNDVQLTVAFWDPDRITDNSFAGWKDAALEHLQED